MKNLINFLAIFLCISSTFAQQSLTKKQIDSLPNTIENQFLKIYAHGKRWNQYKMIEKKEFLSFQKNILDSVAKIKETVVSKNQLITEKESSIEKLNTEIKALNTLVTESKDKENTISLLGIPLTKQLYNSILWGIIGLLFLATIFFFYKYNNNIGITKEAKTNLAELEDEFEKFRKKTIEKEQKLRRQLHDEMNKNRS